MGSSSSKLQCTNNTIPNILNIKTLAVGDCSVGKTCLLITYAENKFPTEYIPTVFDNFTTGVEYEDTLFNLALWDTASSDSKEYSRIRVLAYPKTDIFLICYSVVNYASFNNIKDKWIPEVKRYCPDTPFIIVGTKIDLRDDKETIIKLNNSNNKEPLTFNDGVQLANEVKAIGYVECSSLNRNGLKQVYDELLKYSLEKEIHKDDKHYDIKDYFINANYTNFRKAKSAYK